MNRNDEIRKELEEIAPFLAGLEIRPAFKVPKGYFDELPDTVLESVSPLAALKKEQVFQVPQNYFESLPDLVLAKVAPEKEAETAPVHSTPKSSWIDDLINQVALLFQPRYALRLAAVAILLTAGIVFMQNQTNENVSLAATEIDPLEQYGLSLDDLNDNDLALLLSGDYTEESNGLLNVDDKLLDEMLEDLNELTDEDLEGFL